MTTRIDTSLLDSKQYTKYAKVAGDKTARELLSKSKEELERVIVDCELYERQVVAEKLANNGFQKAKETVADFNGAERETLNPVKAKRALAAAALKSLKDSPISKANDAVKALKDMGATVTVTPAVAK
jgi:hypothetical protein